MSEFQTRVDVCNRALQHCGVPRIVDFDDDTKNATAVAFAYGKLRRAELRRNAWRFALKRALLRPVDINTFLLVPGAWSVTRIYIIGSVVSLGNNYYISNINANLGNDPTSDGIGWDHYYGPLTITPWQGPVPPLVIQQGDGNVDFPVNYPIIDFASEPLVASFGYFAGELVYFWAPGGPPTPNIYLSLASGNTDQPGWCPPWSATQLYNIGDCVYRLNVVGVPVNYQSLLDWNFGHDPKVSPLQWAQIPVLNQPDFRTGQNWVQLDSCSFQSIKIAYPLGSGPASDQRTANIYRLPNNYLKRAPTDPKAGVFDGLGFPSNSFQDDWVLEGDWVVSREPTAIMTRFVADFMDVKKMDDMFCEGLACRIALAVCEELTQSDTRKAGIERDYLHFMGEARLANGIDVGTSMDVMDRWVSCRF